MISTVEEQSAVRAKFYDAARRMYPNVGEPGTVWVLTEVLGWDWAEIQRTSVDGFSRKGYRKFILDADGYRVRGYSSTNTNTNTNTNKAQYSKGGYMPVVVTREWTREEARKLKDWWWLLGL